MNISPVRLTSDPFDPHPQVRLAERRLQELEASREAVLRLRQAAGAAAAALCGRRAEADRLRAVLEQLGALCV